MASRATILLLATACAASPTEATTSTTAVVTRGPLRFSAEFFGELAAARTVEVFAPEIQDFESLTVEWTAADGTIVKEGDVILKFVREPIMYLLREREDELLVADAQLRRTREQFEQEHVNLKLEQERRKLALDLSRLYVVEGVNIVSELELEKARLDVKRAEVELALAAEALGGFARKLQAALDVERVKVDSARRKVEAIRRGLESVDVRAPTAGVVYAPYTRLNWIWAKASPGRVVQGGDKVLAIPDLTAFEAKIYVRPREASLIGVGDTALVTTSTSPDRPVHAKVIKKASFASTRNERMGTESRAGNLKEVEVVLALEESQPDMKPGGTLRTTIASTLADDVLLLPLSALKEDADGFTVTRAKDLVKARVEIGRTTSTHAEILKGLEDQDRIVVQ